LDPPKAAHDLQCGDRIFLANHDARHKPRIHDAFPDGIFQIKHIIKRVLYRFALQSSDALISTIEEQVSLQSSSQRVQEAH
jgi:hypothetical protein